MTERTAIDTPTLEAWLADGREIALIDIREEGLFGVGHLLFASNVPYSRLERDIEALVPRRGTRVVLVGEEDIVDIARRRLVALGYGNVHWLAGGVEGWAAAGGKLFSGIYVPSKAFAEFVEHVFHTPSISATELDRLIAEKPDMIILDSRTTAEYERFHVPGAVSAPGAELVHRFVDLVPSPDTLVVVSCAGRTRGIIGAQALRNAGISNRVLALEGGTQGWRLAKLDVERGRVATYGPVSDAGARASGAYGEAVARRFGVPRIELAQLREWLRDGDRTTYVFDVRQPEEFAQGHLAGAVSVEGGQLVQTLDKWAATRGARIVLVDDTGTRAVVTAHWLRQMGWDAVALRSAPAGTRTAQAGPAAPQDDFISPALAGDHLEKGAAAIHVGPSAEYRQAHVEGAIWVNRSRLSALPEVVARAGTLLVFGMEPALSRLVAVDLAERHPAQRIIIVRGTPDQWREAGLAVVASPDSPPDPERVDFLFWLHDRHGGNADASRAYLDWEQSLPGQIGAPERAGFRLAKPADP